LEEGVPKVRQVPQGCKIWEFQESAGIAVMKVAMNADKDNATQMTDVMKNSAVNPNLKY
jgi:hypothetical protein